MIDWTKPIEAVPCERNPEPVPCEVKSMHPYDVDVFIRGDWHSVTAGNLNDGPGERIAWRYDLDGTANDWMPHLRNVSPLTQG